MSLAAQDLFSVSGKNIIVTGAASGLGYTIAETMVANGANVTLMDRDEPGMTAAAAAFARLAEGEIACAPFDLADPVAAGECVDRAITRMGRIDAIFVNAGVSAGPGYGSPNGVIEAVDIGLWESSMRINLTGALFTIQAAAKHMKTQRSGSIIVTTSVASITTSPLPGYAYHAAKAALAHVMRLAANELVAFGVRVNGIAPGGFPTNMAGGRLKEKDAGALFAATAPMNRLGRMEEIAGPALLLASDASSFMTGVNLPVDGGVATAAT
ncbi:MAG TPA: SDR family oxidoreductase [Sphingomonadaceae bacterium]|nr:SDR family oxidoreductase [Sphingomonadaceae bacterium]